VTPHLSRGELRSLGYVLIVCPLAALFAAARAVTDVLTELRDEETTRGAYERMLGFDEFNALVELDARYADEARYAS
jgi:2-methylisocitrate lyase-like PEP mutase family enzyme